MAIDDFHLSIRLRRFIPRWVKDCPRLILFVFRHRHVGVVGLSKNTWIRTLQRVLAIHGIGARYVITLPEKMIYRNALRKMLALNACCILQTLRRRRPLAIFSWADTVMPPDCVILENLAKDYRVLNYGCRSISKSTVDRAATTVLGYSAIVDPTKWQGPAVEKTDSGNGKHDGRIIKCPIPLNQVDRDMVYMRVIHNEYDDYQVEDLRVPIIDGVVPFVYRKIRSIDDRFSNNNSRVTVIPCEAVFSDEELSQIIRCARAMELDYAEVDVLRDRNDGRIYFIDANWCAYGLPNHITDQDEQYAARHMAEAVAMLLNRSQVEQDARSRLAF